MEGNEAYGAEVGFGSGGTDGDAPRVRLVFGGSVLATGAGKTSGRRPSNSSRLAA